MVDDVSNAGQLREEDRLLVHVFFRVVAVFAALSASRRKPLCVFSSMPMRAVHSKAKKAASRKSNP